jgi:hypothetical protein
MCPWCRNVFPFADWGGRRVILPEATEGFICLAPDDGQHHD